MRLRGTELLLLEGDARTARDELAGTKVGDVQAGIMAHSVVKRNAFSILLEGGAD